MSSKKIKVGVVGAGSMGMNHVRVYSELKDVCDVYVYDPSSIASNSAAQLFSAKIVNNIEDLLVCDAISVTAPTELHFEVGEYFLSKRKPCLIEKPLAYSYSDAQKLVDIAMENDTLLMVGHVEYFNPAFIELQKIINGGTNIYSIDVKRLSYARQNLDKSIDVVSDLMIHDLELVLSLLGNNIKSINAFHVSGSDPWGHVTALLKTETGVVVNLSASRITQNKIRTMMLNTDIGFFSLDFLKQELTLFKSGITEKIDHSENPLFKLDISADKILLRNDEPLRAELKHFIECVINGYAPLVPGVVGRDAVELVEKIKKVASDATY